MGCAQIRNRWFEIHIDARVKILAADGGSVTVVVVAAAVAVAA
jgi:hypothetical protein